jgi:glycosyltransferase involved in cell wall biosynthesis
MKILVITNMYPTINDMLMGSFVKEMFDSLRTYQNVDSKVLAISERRSGILLTPFKYFRLLLKVIVATLFVEKFDVIHSNDAFSTALFGLIPKFFRRKKMVVTIHGVDIRTPLSNKFFKFITRNVLKNVDAIITVSKPLKDVVSKEFGIHKNVSVIPCGINKELFKPLEKEMCRKRLKLPEKKKVFLHISRLSKEKRLPDILKAFSMIKNEDFFLVIGGRGKNNEESSLKKVVEKFGLGNKVMFLGETQREDVIYYMNASDIFILASDYEGSPVTIMEALACGTPVIATRVGGIPDMIDDCKIGLLSGPMDIQELKSNIEKVLDNKVSFDKKEILKKSKEYDWEVISKKIRCVYSNVLNQD